MKTRRWLHLWLLLGLVLPLTPHTAQAAPQRAVNAVGCPVTPAPYCLKLVVDEDGLYRLTPGDLVAAGWSLSAIDPRTLSLTSQGRPVALRVEGEADGRLDGGDFAEFYGQRFRGDQMAEKYTNTNVYWLAAGGTPGPRMTTASAAPQGAPPAPPSFWTVHHAEENHHWFTHHVLNWPTRDTWWWTRMYVTTNPSQKDWDLPSLLPAPAGEVYTATLQIEIATRRKYGAHHFQVFWNGTAGAPVIDEVFLGHTVVQAEAALPGSALLDGLNTAIVRVINDQDAAKQQIDPLGQAHAAALAQLSDPWAIESAAESAKVNAYDELYANYYSLRYRRLYQAVDDQLTFTADATGPQTFTLDGFGAASVLLYDISDPRRPVFLTGASVTPSLSSPGSYRVQAQLSPDTSSRYLAATVAQTRRPAQVVAPLASSVRSTANAADWIVISHHDFLPQAQRLADYRANHDGLRTAVVDVTELYEQFNAGIFHPEAIRQFIAYAVQNWQPPAPQYILLIGDGNWNFKGEGIDVYGAPDPNWIPPYLVWEDPWQGEVGSDNAYVNFDDDPLPELAIGRLPARTLAEAAAMVDKIIAYEAQAGRPVTWLNRALFVADNADSTGNYPQVADSMIASALPGFMRPVRAYLGVTYPETQPAQITDMMVATINEGVGLVTYMGHGTINSWAHEFIWRTQNTERLTNADRLPVVITLNCLDGYFLHGTASLQAVAEETLRHPGGGSVATWSPAGLGTTYVETVLNRGLLDSIFVLGKRRLGDAIVQAKTYQYALLGGSSPYNTVLIHTMTLFGDPALKLQLGQWPTYLPLMTRADRSR